MSSLDEIRTRLLKRLGELSPMDGCCILTKAQEVRLDRIYLWTLGLVRSDWFRRAMAEHNLIVREARKGVVRYARKKAGLPVS